MRSQGYTRPLSILKIRSDVRSKFARLFKRKMMTMLTPKRKVLRMLFYVHVRIYAWFVLQSHQMGELLLRSHNLLLVNQYSLRFFSYLHKVYNGVTSSPVLDPRQSLVDMSTVLEETDIDRLRSIVAQMDFQYRVRQYDNRGIEFRTYLHAPEIHPVSGSVFLEREEGHVLKVCIHVHVHTHCFTLYMC